MLRSKRRLFTAPSPPRLARPCLEALRLRLAKAYPVTVAAFSLALNTTRLSTFFVTLEGMLCLTGK